MVVEVVLFVASLTINITVPTVTGMIACDHVEEYAAMYGPLMFEKEVITGPDVEDVSVGACAVL